MTAMVEALRRRLDDGEVVLLDGGTGSELEARGVPMDGTAWSALAALTHRDTLRGVHEDYIRAGAEVIIANTFSANRLVLAPAGFADRVEECNRLAVETAIEARENAADHAVLVAGSLTALGATQSPPDPHRDPAQVLECFREQVAAQAQAGVDLFVLEMVPSALYGQAAARAAAESGLPIWLGMSATWAGEPGWEDEHALSELVAELIGPAVMAVLAMHTEVDEIGSALEEIGRRWRGVTGAYAHHGDWNPPHWIFTDIAPERYAAAARSWVERGAQLIGGCCGIRPEHIARLREELPARIPAAPPGGSP